jgi:hypothetical protein
VAASARAFCPARTDRRNRLIVRSSSVARSLFLSGLHPPVQSLNA